VVRGHDTTDVNVTPVGPAGSRGRRRPRGRAVVLVGTPAAPYSRGLRIARTLTDAGYGVEIAAVAGDDAPDIEQDGAVIIRRYGPSGPYAAMAATHRPLEARRTARLPMPIRVARHTAAALRRWAFWPHTVRGWWATLARDLEPADLYHACGSLAIAAALAARDRDRRAGRTSRVIYDAIDDVVGGNNVLGMPEIVRAVVTRRERRWARAADGRITVNDALAATLSRRWGVAERPVVVPNWPARILAPNAAPSDRIRGVLGLSGTTRIVVFQGRLGPNLGLDEAAEAIMLVPDAVLCLIGFGRGRAASLARDSDPRFAGRHRTLPAVHPDELLEWTASADVALVPLPPVSANQRASTPNKFWEAIAAGTPLVIGPDLPVMGDLVRTFDLGVIARSLGPADLASAIRTVLDVEPAAAADRRRRIATVARDRFSWRVAAERYRDLVERLDPVAGSSG
jgi:glycosyltransferase involved in cell wall biosynthesis